MNMRIDRPQMNAAPQSALDIVAAQAGRPRSRIIVPDGIDPQVRATDAFTREKAAHILSTLDRPKIAMVTDAFLQTNGVTRTQDDLNRHMITAPEYRDWNLTWITPYDFKSWEMKSPWQTDNVRWTWAQQSAVKRLFEMHRGGMGKMKPTRRHAFDRVHINTEQQVGWAVKNYCLANGIPHTTAYHTNWDLGFDDMVPLVAKIKPLRDKLLDSYIYEFHRTSDAVLCVSAMVPKLLEIGIPRERIVEWTHGVNTAAFSPSFRDESTYAGMKRPVALYVARCSPEKGVPELQQLVKGGWPGSIVFVGDGVALEKYRAEFPDIKFVGAKRGEELSRHFASADVFIQPSTFETWGCTTVEAMASGLPVVAVDAPAHHQVLGNSGVGIIDNDLARGALAMLERIKTPEGKAEMTRRAVEHASSFTVSASVDTLVNALPMAPGARFLTNEELVDAYVKVSEPRAST